jgi:peptidyl-prolyl cis-trans isomerase SurA
MQTRVRTAWWLAMALAAMACAAQEVPAGGATPGSTEQGTPVTRTGPARSENPESNKPASGNDGLTFLPELKPTDGVVNLAPQKSGEEQVAADAAAMHEQPMLLDRAVAVINGEVILASDVREQQRFAVFEPFSAPGEEFSPMVAMQQIVNRTLLLDQMEEQQLVPPPTDEEVDKQLTEVRPHLPACAGQCNTDEGWKRFLAAHGFTEAELHERWKERMQILDFVNARFRTGIRITNPEIEMYYKETLVPEFEKRKLPPPPLDQVSARIEEVLLQQHVNVLLTDYLRSLKDAGSVLILDPQYNSLGNSPATTATSSGGSDMPGPARRSGGEQ